MKYEIIKGSEKDFEGAPEWCTIIYKYGNSDAIRFCNGWKEGCKFSDTKEFLTRQCDVSTIDLIRYKIIADRRPINEQAWDVSTPPPVGTECEVLFTSEVSVFERARILHVGDDGIVGRWLTGDSTGGLFDYMYIPHDYRPIRSTEDVARDEAIDAMRDVGYTLPAAIRFTKEEMAALYDAGYRKQ